MARKVNRLDGAFSPGGGPAVALGELGRDHGLVMDAAGAMSHEKAADLSIDGCSYRLKVET